MKFTQKRLKALRAFSEGRIGYRQLIREQGIESDEELFLLMCGADLTMPTVSDEGTKQMLDNFEKVLKAAGL